MQVPNNQFDSFNKAQWVDYLKEGAFRGAKINKVAKRVEGDKFVNLIKDANKIKVTYDGSQTITIKLDKLLKKHDSWTLSRLIHNIKMAFSSSYKKDFKARIDKFADELVKSKQRSGFSQGLKDFADDQKIHSHSLDDIKAFFNANRKFIDESTGDKEDQENLFKLSSIVREKFGDAKLAHLIASKATAIVRLPDGQSFSNLPKDIQGLIFSEAGSSLLVSKGVIENVSAEKIKWINENNVCLKELGCRTAKEAVQYVIDNKLTSANLSAIHLDDRDLKKLSQCLELKKLSLSTRNLSGSKLVDVLSHLPKLEDLSLDSSPGVSVDHISEILENHPDIQHLTLNSLHTDDRVVKAIVNLTGLKSLSLRPVAASGDHLAEILEKHTDIEYLDLGSMRMNDRLVNAIVNLGDLQDLSLYPLQPSNDHMVKILESHPDLRGLMLSHGNIVRDAILNLNNLHRLDVDGFGDAKAAEILEKHTQLEILKFQTHFPFGGKTVKMIGNLSHLTHLRMSVDRLLELDVHYNIQTIDISGTDITFDEVLKLIGKFPNLQTLNLSNCHYPKNDSTPFWPYSDKQVQKIQKKYPHLKVLI